MTETRPVALRTVVVHATDSGRVGCGVIDNDSSFSYDSATPSASPAPTASLSAAPTLDAAISGASVFYASTFALLLPAAMALVVVIM